MELSSLNGEGKFLALVCASSVTGDRRSPLLNTAICFYFSLRASHFSLLASRFSLRASHFSLLTSHFSLLASRFALRTSPYLLFVVHHLEVGVLHFLAALLLVPLGLAVFVGGFLLLAGRRSCAGLRARGLLLCLGGFVHLR